MTDEDRQYEREWHLDKKVPIAVILTIVMQSAAFIWFGARLDHRVEALERESVIRIPQADRLTRVEVKLEGVQEGIVEIKRLIQSRQNAAQ
jgi:hypothetical protein